MEKEKERESINWFLIILDIIIGAIILLAINIITSVDKVYAMDYINFYNNNGILKRCEQTNTCYYNLPNYTGYEFGNTISLSTNIDLTVRIQYSTEYYYKNWTINESGLYVFLRGSSITPLTCTDSGNQTTTGSDWVTKRYNHNITCTLSIVGTDAYEIGLAMTVSQVEGNNYSAWVTNTLTITNFNVTTTPNTSGIENAINSGNANIINNNNQNTQTIIDIQNSNNQAVIENQNQNTDRLEEAIENQNNKCETYNYTNEPKTSTEGYLNTTGDIVYSSYYNYSIGEYIKLNKGKTYNLILNYTSSVANYCIYNNNKTLINCTLYSNQNNTITMNEDGYIRYSISNGNTSRTSFTGEYCYNLLEGSENIEDSKQSNENVTAYENLDPLTINTNDLNYMEFSLDPNSNTWVWDRVTEYLNLNSIITNMTLTLLAIGLIKLVLSR